MKEERKSWLDINRGGEGISPVETSQEERKPAYRRSGGVANRYLGYLSLAALWLLPVLFLGSFYINSTGLQKTVIHVVQGSHTDRLRMVVQQVGSFSRRLVKGETPAEKAVFRRHILESVEDLARIHRSLIEGDEELGLPREPSAAMKAIYFEPPFELDSQIVEFMAHARGLSEAPDEELSLEHSDLVAIISALDRVLLPAMDRAVGRHHAQEDIEIHAMFRNQLLLMGFGIAVVIIIVGFFTFEFFKRKKAELELERREASFQNLIEGSIQGIVIHRNHQPLFVNQAFARIYGYDTPGDIYGLESLEELLPHSERKAAQGGGNPGTGDSDNTVQCTSRGLHRDGRELWLENIVTTVDWEGSPAEQKTIVDITEARITEEKRQEGEKRYRDLIEGSIEGIAIHRYHKVQFANQAMADIFGYDSPREILAKESMLDLIAPHEWEKLRGYHNARIQGQPAPAHYEFQGVRKEGSLIWVDSVNRKVIWDGEPAIQITLFDITKRKQAQEQLNLLAQAIDQAGDSVFITSPDGTILYVNPGFERISGYHREEVIGRNPRFLKSGYQTEAFYRNMWSTLLQGKPWKGRYRNRRKDGSIYEVDGTNSPVRNEKGEITQIISVQKDITYQGVLENRLRQSQRIEAIGNLAGGIAHDFNNLLMPIIGFAELALHRHEPGSEDFKDLTEVQIAAYRAKDLVSQILLFSRKTESARQPVFLHPIATEVINLLKSTLPRTVEIREEIEEGLSPVFADPTQMNQVLLNLCVNASQAMAHGGVMTIAMHNVELEDEEVYLGDKVSGSFVRIRVQDTGTGIPEEVLGKIFEPFYTTKEVGKGSGLGLSTVFGIVSQHEGHLKVLSKPDQGTTFEVYLLPCGETDIIEEPSRPPVIGGDESILFIDDEEPITIMAKRTLELQGYRVTAMKESEEALEVFTRTPDDFDLIITDQTMPRLTGFDLSMKARTIRPDIPIILCTGFSESITPEKALEQGINKFVYKPLTTDDLLRMVREVLDSTRREKTN